MMVKNLVGRGGNERSIIHFIIKVSAVLIMLAEPSQSSHQRLITEDCPGLQ